MTDEIASAALQRLLGVNKVALNELAKRRIVILGAIKKALEKAGVEFINGKRPGVRLVALR
jgi:hypothetical protein